VLLSYIVLKNGEMDLKKGTIHNTPLNPLSRGEFLREFSQEGSYTKFLLICKKYII
jgi:hypothetical protein